MPRWNRDDSADAAARAVRHRFTARLGAPGGQEPLLPLGNTEDPPVSGEGDPGDGIAGDEGGSEQRPARVRWRTPGRVAVLLALAAIVLLGFLAWRAAAQTTTFEPLNHVTPSGGSSSGAEGADGTGDAAAGGGTAGAGGADSRQIVLHVAGAVQHPGVVRLPEGSRVFEAIAAAGGATPSAELNGLNLAAVVQDGTKVHVPAVGEAPSGAVAGDGMMGADAGGSGVGSGGKVNLNSASVEELGTLPRVGPVMAQRIVDWRREHGPFASVEELDAVDGVGPKLMESLKDLVTV
ncbi:ComEA family DNA-binding protein [Arthrobacter cavernae]|uniref:ComEA family DNA-binding protein n=1 Tax=Arthrobacter cavernae TaxID=2817681 RepID=A0A939HCN2_9MICC|nr:ComEA family DNA-binding protein [Arthrobacter cavernae]MBO1268419.1 ComEA family DNA-binding protein [Arthrobacter cavernae]